MSEPQQIFRLRLTFAKQGRLAMLSHLEVARALERTVRRAGLPYAVSQGFSPHMLIAFGAALPVGVGGTHEIADVRLTHYVSADKALSALQDASVADLMVKDCRYIEPKAAAASVAFPVSTYRALLSCTPAVLPLPDEIHVVRKKKEKVLDDLDEELLNHLHVLRRRHNLVDERLVRYDVAHELDHHPTHVHHVEGVPLRHGQRLHQTGRQLARAVHLPRRRVCLRRQHLGEAAEHAQRLDLRVERDLQEHGGDEARGVGGERALALRQLLLGGGLLLHGGGVANRHAVVEQEQVESDVTYVAQRRVVEEPVEKHHALRVGDVRHTGQEDLVDAQELLRVGEAPQTVGDDAGDHRERLLVLVVNHVVRQVLEAREQTRVGGGLVQRGEQRQ